METPDGQDLQILINALKDVRDALPEVLSKTATSMSLTAKALAERQIKDIGFGQVYSATPVPTFFLKGRVLNNQGTRAIEQEEKKQASENRKQKTDFQPTMSYKELRQVQGLQSSHVDLTYSGKMWAGMQPMEVEINGYEYTAPLGGTNTESQQAMNYNYARYGDFIGEVLTGDVLDKIYEVGASELIRFLDDKLGWATTIS